MESPTIYGIHLHHYMYGGVVLILSLIFSNVAIYAVGVGLIVDELPILLLGAPVNWVSYKSMKFRQITIAFIIAIFFIRQMMVLPFTH
jgi:hypothetical protein